METLVGDDVETDSGLNFFADGSNSNAFVRSIKQQRREEKKYVAAPVHNIPPPPVDSRNTWWKYPEYRNFTERYQTFAEWPRFLKGPSTRDLARSGFIYTKISDKVTCFCCGLTFKNWEPRDDAFDEHIRWSKQCYYARMVASVI